MDAVAAWVELSANDELTGAETAMDTTSIVELGSEKIGKVRVAMGRV